MSYQFRPAGLIDFLRILPNLREVDYRSIRAMADSEPNDYWAAHSFLGAIESYAMDDDSGAVIAICGFSEVRSGVLHIWAVMTPRFTARAAIHSFRFMERLLAAIEVTNNHRIECFVLADFDGGHRTIKRLGFTEEGVQRAAGSFKEDVVIYSRRKS